MSVFTNINTSFGDCSWRGNSYTHFAGRGEQAGWEFAEHHNHYARMLPIESTDVLLVALPMSEISWLALVEAAIFSGADFILVDENQTPVQLAEQVVSEDATIIAATDRMWKDICEQLSNNVTLEQPLRGVVLDKDGRLRIERFLFKHQIAL